MSKVFFGTNGKIYNLSYQQIFVEQDGNKMLADVPDYFSIYFDWQVTRTKVYKNTDTPKTVYIKTDFLPFFVNTVLPQIHNEFILITACSDFSPEINFNREYHILLNSPKVKFWFMNNMRNKNEKSYSLPAGFGASAGNFWPGCSEKDADELVLKMRGAVNIKQKISDKIFCGFRNRDSNSCGSDMVIRPAILEIVNKNKDLFDIYDPMPFPKFLETLSKYKYCLNPHGNGMDPSPTCWLSLAMYTIPVIYKTPNVVDMFTDTDSVIFFEKFEEIINRDLYSNRSFIKFEFLTCEYWANKIKSKI
jgi:hypothetical protein